MAMAIYDVGLGRLQQIFATGDAPKKLLKVDQRGRNDKLESLNEKTCRRSV